MLKSEAQTDFLLLKVIFMHIITENYFVPTLIS